MKSPLQLSSPFWLLESSIKCSFNASFRGKRLNYPFDFWKGRVSGEDILVFSPLYLAILGDIWVYFQISLHCSPTLEKKIERKLGRRGKKRAHGKEVFPAASWKFPARSRLGGGGSS